MADLTNVNLNGTSYNFRDDTAIKGVKVNGVELTMGADNKVNIVNDYLMKTTIINCRTLDQNSWYPVTFQLSSVNVELIEIILRNSISGYIVSWSTHAYGNCVSSHKRIEMLGDGWGGNYNKDLRYGRVSVSDCNYVEVDPIQKLGQIGQCSLGYVYVRGGANYTFRLSGNITPILHTEDYVVGQGTSYEQTLKVLTEVPNALINVTIANKSDIKDGVLTIQKNGVSVGTFSANQSSNKNINIEVPTKLSQLTDDVVAGKYLPAVPDSHITSVDTLDYNRRGAFSVAGATDSQYFEIGHGEVQMTGNCNFYMRLKVTMVTTDNYNSVYELEIHGNAAGNSGYTVLTPKMYVRKYRLYSGEPDKSLFKFYFKDTRTNDTFQARRDFDWILYFTPLTNYVSVYTEMLEFAYNDYGTTYGNKRTQDKYVLWKGSNFPNPSRQSAQTLIEGYTLATTEHLIPFNRLGDTMLGDLNLGKKALVIWTDATSWNDVDRSIPFSYSDSRTRIGLYKDDFTYNPNTGVLKAGAFARNGGTAAQFLKADGSVDSSTYLKSVSVVNNSATLNYGEQDIIIGEIQGQKITVTMPDAQGGDIPVVDSNPTLAWGQTKQVGTVDGKVLRVTMPANPNTDTHYTTGITAGATGTTTNSATTNGNTYIKVKDDSTHRSQIKIQGSGATNVTSDANGVITINSTDTDTKVTSVANHYTPTQNTSSNLPTTIEDCTFINQIHRDAKGHVVGVSRGDVNFTTYGVDVTLETSTNVMSDAATSSPNSVTPQNVLKFLLRMAEYCNSNSYKKYCNGFIGKVLLSNGNPTTTLVFNNGFTQHTINTSTPIYFEFYCDNVVGFLDSNGEKVDAHATLYATTPSPYYYPKLITLDWKSADKRQVWGVYDPDTRCTGQKLSGFYYDDLGAFVEDMAMELQKTPRVDVVLNASGAAVFPIEKMIGTLYGSRRLKITLAGDNNIELSIDKYLILMNGKLNEVSIMINFDEKGNFIDCSIS